MRMVKRAFSLIEVILTLGLLTVVLVVVFTVMIGGLKMQQRAEGVEHASSVAREQIEALHAVPFSIVAGEFKGSEGDMAIDNFPPPPFPSADRGQEFFVDLEIEEFDERIWSVHVTIRSDSELMTTLETLIKR